MTEYYYFLIKGYEKPFGYIHKSIFDQIDWSEYWHVDTENRFLTLLEADSVEERSRRVQETLWNAHQARKLDMVKKWTDEQFSLYSQDGEHVLDMSLLGSGVFGAVCSGVTLIAWTQTDHGRKYWLQRRSKNKNVHPGKLDTTAGGNIQLNEKPTDAMIREAREEASIPEEYSRAHLISCGTISYHLAANSDGSPGSQPHVQATYEMEFNADIVPKPFDHEVESFVQMTEAEIRESLFGDEFKMIVGVSWLGHFIRRGILKPEDDIHFEEICSRLHRKHDFFFA